MSSDVPSGAVIDDPWLTKRTLCSSRGSVRTEEAGSTTVILTAKFSIVVRPTGRKTFDGELRADISRACFIDHPATELMLMIVNRRLPPHELGTRLQHARRRKVVRMPVDFAASCSKLPSRLNRRYDQNVNAPETLPRPVERRFGRASLMTYNCINAMFYGGNRGKGVEETFDI